MGHRLSTKLVLASDQSSVRSWPVQPIKELSSAAGRCAGRGCTLIRPLANNAVRFRDAQFCECSAALKQKIYINVVTVFVDSHALIVVL